ncbi:MAG TPA: hypothetical protein VGI39_01950 [Polyangiaceae bacterium]|jgi:hypothetical protein
MSRSWDKKIAALACTALLAGAAVLDACSSGGGNGTSTAPPPGDDAGDGATTTVTPPSEAGTDATTADSGDDGPVSDCASDLPSSLSCTGLYSDLASKTVAPGVEAFTPAVPLWSDGSGKNRWIQLPAGTTIDRSDPNDWVFPVGTKLWKEFARDGKRIETRFFHKQSDGTWTWTTYVWDAQEASAIVSPNGADLPLEDGATYHVPSHDECVECHNGRPEHVMGFEEVSLGTAGASGLTLAALTSRGLLSPAPSKTSLSMADDGSGDAAKALGWLHVNCGVACHNANPMAGASFVGMNLRLDATLLDGRAPSGFDALTTTVGVASTTGVWGSDQRIAPGDPDHSLILELTSRRGQGLQMPPLGTVDVDTSDEAILRDWVAKMAPLEDGGADAGDGGVADAAVDAESDAAVDAGTDAAPHDAASE